MTEPLAPPDPPVLGAGRQRDWAWRGWQVRYSFAPGPAEGSPVVLLHGFGAALGQWRYVLPALAKNRPVYALDLLGFGASEKAATTYGTALWVEQVSAFCRQMLGRPAVLVGNSLGALVALATAVSNPDLVTGLVLISLPDVARTGIPAWAWPLATLPERVLLPLVVWPLFYWARRPAVIRQVCRQFVYGRPAAVTEELVRILATPPQDAGAAQTLYRLSMGTTRRDYVPPTPPLLAQATQPRLFLWGERDRIFSPRLGQRLAQVNPQGTTWVELPGAGHCPQDEVPDQVVAAILSWMAQQHLS